MDKQIWKPIVAGAVIGAALYVLPFFFFRFVFLPGRWISPEILLLGPAGGGWRLVQKR